jgi:hypothetical protein
MSFTDSDRVPRASSGLGSDTEKHDDPSPMPNPRFSFTLTLGSEDAEAVEKIAFDSHLTPTGAAKRAFLERLNLERAGWKLGDERIATAVRAIAGLKGKDLERAFEFIEKL